MSWRGSRATGPARIADGAGSQSTYGRSPCRREPGGARRRGRFRAAGDPRARDLGRAAGEPRRCLGLRTELNAGFAADGYARASGRPAPFLLSTGPGALNSLTALMEAASAHVPVVAIASQIPSDLIGRAAATSTSSRSGRFLRADRQVDGPRGDRRGDPALLAEAWCRALTPPAVPSSWRSRSISSPGRPTLASWSWTRSPAMRPPPGGCSRGSPLLAERRGPVLWAGGGVLRSGAWDELRALAERLGAAVATTYMGKGAFPEDHPLALGSACDERHSRSGRERRRPARVGTELGAETTGQYSLRTRRTGDPGRRRSRADRRDATRRSGSSATRKRCSASSSSAVPGKPREDGRRDAGGARAREQGEKLERGLLETVRDALPRDAVSAWDMTILAYWAAAHFPALEPRTFLYPLGSGTLGYAWPAALGAAAAPGACAGRRRGRRLQLREAELAAQARTGSTPSSSSSTTAATGSSASTSATRSGRPPRSISSSPISARSGSVRRPVVSARPRARRGSWPGLARTARRSFCGPRWRCGHDRLERSSSPRSTASSRTGPARAWRS